MAITKKNQAIQEEKAAMRNRFSQISDGVRDAVSKVPPAVISGDARLAREWRERAEEAYRSPPGLPNMSVEKMKERVAQSLKTLEFLRNPSVS